MPIIKQKMILRDDLKANPGVIYLFGDNLNGVGYGGQALELRGEPNALGIPTKVSPSIFLSDSHITTIMPIYRAKFRYVRDNLLRGRCVIIPLDGLGTGRALLQIKAPQIWALLQKHLSMLERLDDEWWFTGQ